MELNEESTMTVKRVKFDKLSNPSWLEKISDRELIYVLHFYSHITYVTSTNICTIGLIKMTLLNIFRKTKALDINLVLEYNLYLFLDYNL